jgi:hypothetical protein
LCDFEDAADSYAATFLSMAWAYYEAGGSAAFLNAPGNKAGFEAVAGVILALQAEDGLTVAKRTYPVKFLMDNSEVYAGLRAMTRLAEMVFGDSAAAQRYGAAAARVQRGIERNLFNPDRGLYRTAKFADGSFQEADLGQWYPGTVALAWPHLFGVTAGHSQRAHSQMAAVNAHWEWPASVADPAGFLWPSIGHAALLTGDCARARAQMAFIKARRFPEFGYPFTVDDGGWLLMTLSQLAR